MLHVGEMDSEVCAGGNLKIQPGSPAVLKTGGGCDGALNFLRSLPPTVFTISPCLWVLRAEKMDAVRSTEFLFLVSALFSCILEKGGGGEVGIGGFLHTTQLREKCRQNPHTN